MSLRSIAVALVGTALVSTLLVSTVLPGATATADPAARTVSGTVGGTSFTVEVPAHWNGTLMLWSHWYAGDPATPAPPPQYDADHPEIRGWLLDHGYALAGARYEMLPFTSTAMVRDQLAVLDWFAEHVGRPRRTIAWGKSLGGQVSTVLAERHPERISAALPMCGNVAGSVAPENAQLDVAFALKTLLFGHAPVRLTGFIDPAANTALANGLLRDALGTPAGRARLALAGALGDLPGWVDSLAPRPTDPDDAVVQLYLNLRYQIGPLLFGTGRTQLEAALHGNPSWNTGVDYRAQLARSSQRDLVTQEYQRAGIDLDADLASLDAAPRISADPAAVARLAVQSGTLGLSWVPVLTMHSTGDGTDPVEAERWYADHRAGDLRQAFVERANHCFFTTAEELAALQALVTRLDTGRWGDTSPQALNAAANAFRPQYRSMYSYFSEGTATVDAAFVAARPNRMIR